jgi:hypothetical protein
MEDLKAILAINADSKKSHFQEEIGDSDAPIS